MFLNKLFKKIIYFLDPDELIISRRMFFLQQQNTGIDDFQIWFDKRIS